MRRACKITLSDADRMTLERWSRGRSTQARLVTRARVVLSAAEGKENKDIAADLNISRGAVARWRDRFDELGVAGLEKDAPRGGRPPKARDDLVRRIIEMTTQQKPANATHWSTRTLAKALGTNHSLVNRVWRANGLKPHLSKTFNRLSAHLGRIISAFPSLWRDGLNR
jgi:transposase